MNHVERFILEGWHTCQRFGSDYGYDLLMSTFDEQGYAEPGSVYFQIKAGETLREIRTEFVYDVDIRDYNLWMREKMPVIVVLYDASLKCAFWLAVQQHFKSNDVNRPKKGAKYVRIRVPKRQALNQRAIANIRQLKQDALQLEFE